MSIAVAVPQTSHGRHNSSLVSTEPFWVRCILITLALIFLLGFLVMPLAVVFSQAFSKGWSVYASAITEPTALAAIRLTLLVAAISVPLNLVFGLSAAWAIAKF
ncbi:MAG: sulfate/thiosulfate ABC transporter permease CysW, partial [Candidatus Methylumidiphilus sp.]